MVMVMVAPPLPAQDGLWSMPPRAVRANMQAVASPWVRVAPVRRAVPPRCWADRRTTARPGRTRRAALVAGDVHIRPLAVASASREVHARPIAGIRQVHERPK